MKKSYFRYRMILRRARCNFFCVTTFSLTKGEILKACREAKNRIPPAVPAKVCNGY